MKEPQNGNGLFRLKRAEDLFKKAQEDNQVFHEKLDDSSLFNLLCTLAHLREWICPRKGKKHSPHVFGMYASREKAQAAIDFSNQLFKDKDYEIVSGLCNNAKHYWDSSEWGDKTAEHEGAEVGFFRVGDRLRQRNFSITVELDGKEKRVDLRSSLSSVLRKYAVFFSGAT